jgi:hypothetical protein
VDRFHDRRLDVATGEGGEGATFGGIKQLDGPDQADVAPLDEIDEKRAATLVSAGDRSDQVKTPLQQPLPGEVIVVPLDRWPEPPLLLGSELPPRGRMPLATARHNGPKRYVAFLARRFRAAPFLRPVPFRFAFVFRAAAPLR